MLPLEKLWEHYERIIKHNGAIVLTAQTPFDKVLGVSNLELLRYEWIWEKTAATGHLNVHRAPMKAHENILVFYKSLPTYNPQKTVGHKRVVSSAASRNGCRPSDNYGKQSGTQISYDATDRYPRSVLTLPTDKQKQGLHPTQKPVTLFEYLIRTYTNPGEVVLDNCAGSATTAVAAKNTNRRWICMEQEEKYVDIARARLAALQPQLAL